MRPVLNRQSALKAPLNEILGREANVRVLRVLVCTQTPMTASKLAESTGLHISGISRTVSHLEEFGIVDLVGVGSRRPVQLRRTHPLASALEALFHAESARFDTVVERLTDAAGRAEPLPRAAWLQGAVIEQRDELEDPLVVGVLCRAHDLDKTVASLESALGDLELEMDVTIEVRGRTEADLLAGTNKELTAIGQALPLLGPPPLAIINAASKSGARTARPRRPFSHAELDARARDFAAAIARRLQTDPSLVARARTHIADRLPRASAGERRELREWDRILRTMSLPRLRRFLLDTGERATRLRQTFPFTGILTAKEQRELLATRRRTDTKKRP